MPKKMPHSDQSSRAQRRRAERESPPEPLPQPQEGMSITINDLVLKVGAQTMEIDALRAQNVMLQNQVAALAQQLSFHTGDGAGEGDGALEGESAE